MALKHVIPDSLPRCRRTQARTYCIGTASLLGVRHHLFDLVKRVDAVTTADVMAVRLPIWSTKRVTAGRVRQRIGAVMKWAVAQGYRDDNPAGDAISVALPKAAVRKQHMRALPHAEVGAALQRVKGSGAYRGTMLTFEFLVLTAARSGEVRNARWEQIDRDGAVWTIRAERMKAGREHRVPLSPRALEVLDGAAELFDGQGLVFPSPTGRVLNHAALTDLLHGLGNVHPGDFKREDPEANTARTRSWPSAIREGLGGE